MTNFPPRWVTLAVFLLFGVGLVLSVALVRFTIAGLPVRAGFMFAALGTALFFAPAIVLEAVRRTRYILLIILIFAVLGSIVSLFGGTSPGTTIQQLVEIHLQGAIGLVLACWLLIVMGARPLAFAFIFAWLLSALVAMGQAAGIDFAWQLRATAGNLMGDPAITRSFYDMKVRAMGLSYTPVHLATQSCLAFAAMFGLRLIERKRDFVGKIDWPLILLAILAIATCIASGNRSPLVGFAAFLTAYIWLASPRMAAVLLPALVVLILAAIPLLEVLDDAGFRFANTDNSSAEGRSTLSYYGIQLILDRPIGYGLSFESTEHWAPYAHEVRHMDNPNTIRNFAVHNYFLMILGKYGLMALAALPLLLPRNRFAAMAWLGFLPYMLHILFHNDGPLNGDFFIWYLLPLYLAGVEAMRNDPRLPRAPKYSRRYARENAEAKGGASPGLSGKIEGGQQI